VKRSTRIVVSDHALLRAIERFAPVPIQDLVRLIVRETGEALRAGRASTRKPARFVARGTDPELYDGAFLTWNAEQSRAYVVAEVVDRVGPLWLVKTSLVADPLHERAERARQAVAA
jgi:hypothetical protein